MGDPAGIGLDIVAAATADRLAGDLPPFVVIADPDAVAARVKQIGLTTRIVVVGSPVEVVMPLDHTIFVLPVLCAAPVKPGRPDPANGAATIRSIELGTELVRKGQACGLVTNPIAKDVLHAAGFSHPGHTEFLGVLAERYWGTRVFPVMMLASPELKVVPVTVHIALAKVPGALTKQLIVETARTTIASLSTDFGLPHPRLAFCGLNPHAGESGYMGHEDQTVIRPAIETLLREGHDVTGPHPADTLFHAAARSRYDAALAMYHDQGLIPLKTLAFDHGVNVTLGLPFVRTSPDHGTAFDIAGRGTASIGSFVAALKMANSIALRRAGRVA